MSRDEGGGGQDKKAAPSPRINVRRADVLPSSQNPTPPAFTFGVASRESQERVFISKKHEKLKPSLESPGPIYKMVSTTGEGPKPSFGTSPQRVEIRAQYPDSSVDLIEGSVDSQKIKFDLPKRFLFGSESKDCNKNAVILKHHPQANLGMLSPGPLAYYPKKETVEKKSESYTISMKTPILGSQPQTPRNVGPGKYENVATAMDHDSTKKRFKGFMFGKQRRFPEPEMDKAVLQVSPPLNSMGSQLSSRKATSPRYGFGTATREAKSKTFLAQVPEDLGPASALGKVHMFHPVLPVEKDVIKWTPRGIGNQGMN
jgi:hypothetical protein